MVSEDGPSCKLSANGPNFVEAVQEWFDEEDFSDADAELNWNEPILISDHDKNSELYKTNISEGYTRQHSSSHKVH
jgi:hypothetical protein